MREFVYLSDLSLVAVFWREHLYIGVCLFFVIFVYYNKICVNLLLRSLVGSIVYEISS